MGRLTGRVGLVTGSGSGIGAAAARRPAREGAAVLVTDVQDEAGKRIAGEITDAGGQGAYAHLDVTSEADWEAAVALAVSSFGGLDILVNNAGMGDLAAAPPVTAGDLEMPGNGQDRLTFARTSQRADCHPRAGPGSSAEQP